MQVLTPDRTDAQRAQQLEALVVANQFRSYRARLKRDIRAGRVDALAVLVDPPTEILTMRVFDLLLAQPQVGRKKANRWLKAFGVGPSRQVGELTPRQRAQLAGWM